MIFGPGDKVGGVLGELGVDDLLGDEDDVDQGGQEERRKRRRKEKRWVLVARERRADWGTPRSTRAVTDIKARVVCGHDLFRRCRTSVATSAHAGNPGEDAEGSAGPVVAGPFPRPRGCAEWTAGCSFT